MTEQDIRRAFKQRFRQLVCESNQTQVEISKGTGINNKLINRYLNGEIIPYTFNVCRICEYFGVSADWLLGLKDKGSKDEKTDSTGDGTGHDCADECECAET